MLFFSVLLAVALLSSLAVSTPVLEPDWTYLDIYQYLVKRGSIDHPAAKLVQSHINMTARDWNEVYQHDIAGPGGAILTVDHSPAGRALKQRGYPSQSITAYILSNDCTGSAHFTWKNPQPDLCYEYWEGEIDYQMGSLKVTDFDYSIMVSTFPDRNCASSGVAVGTNVPQGTDLCVGWH